MEAIAPSNANYDFNAYNASQQIWNGSAFVTEAVADYASYRIAATKKGDANSASVDAWFTATAPNGATSYIMRLRGATLADSYVVAGPAAVDPDIDGYTQDESLRLILSAMAGNVAGGGTTTNTVKSADGSKTRITATVDSSGNRTVTALDAS